MASFKVHLCLLLEVFISLSISRIDLATCWPILGSPGPPTYYPFTFLSLTLLLESFPSSSIFDASSLLSTFATTFLHAKGLSIKCRRFYVKCSISSPRLTTFYQFYLYSGIQSQLLFIIYDPCILGAAI